MYIFAENIAVCIAHKCAAAVPPHRCALHTFIHKRYCCDGLQFEHTSVKSIRSFTIYRIHTSVLFFHKLCVLTKPDEFGRVYNQKTLLYRP